MRKLGKGCLLISFISIIIGVTILAGTAMLGGMQEIKTVLHDGPPKLSVYWELY